jgi:hypothetical protein
MSRLEVRRELHTKQLTAATQITTEWIIITTVWFAGICDTLVGLSLIVFGPMTSYCSNFFLRFGANYPEFFVATNTSA